MDSGIQRLNNRCLQGTRLSRSTQCLCAQNRQCLYFQQWEVNFNVNIWSSKFLPFARGQVRLLRSRSLVPRANSCHARERRRSETERDDKFSGKAWGMKSHRNSPRITGNEAEAAVTQRFPPIRAGMTLLLVSNCVVTCVLYSHVLFYVIWQG